ncbi:MAG: hypothetical protein LKE30_04855 [Bacteroidales bacterium]|jgi:uncharacterized membrane protein|nr:hypothetical protein [Bacteroidales bacterium]
MNRIAFKNFWKVLLSGLLILAMMLVQIEDVVGPVKFWVGFIVMIAVIVYILYVVVKISNELNESKNVIIELKNHIRELEVGKLEDFEKKDKIKE